MLEVINVIVGLLSVFATLLSTAVGLRQLRQHRPYTAPADISTEPAGALALDQQPASPPLPARRPFATYGQASSRNTLPPGPHQARPPAQRITAPGPVRWAVSLMFGIGLYPGLLIFVLLAMSPFLNRLGLIGAVFFLAHAALVPSLLGVLVARGSDAARKVTIIVMVALMGWWTFVWMFLGGPDLNALATSVLAVIVAILAVTVLLVLPATRRYFGGKLKRGRQHRLRSTLIVSVSILLMLDGALLTLGTHYVNSAAGLTVWLPPRPVDSEPGWDGKASGAVSIEELSSYYDNPERALARFREFGAKRAAVTNWITTDQHVLIMLVELADAETANRYLTTTSVEGVTAWGGFGPPNSAWFSRADPNDRYVMSVFYATADDVVSIVTVWDYNEKDFTSAMAIAKDVIEQFGSF